MRPEGGFGLYVHWPFCAAKCPYCDFNSHVRGTIDHVRWADALVRELETMAAGFEGRIVDSIFFGGGTPSLMDPETVRRVITSARGIFTLRNDVEITMEANPTSVDATRFAGYAESGVNRISMGIQSLIDSDLKALGRLHTASEAKAAFRIARDLFPTVSFDLIYARQNQTLDQWRDELTEALDLAVDHLSLYQLTIEAGTPFAARAERGLLAGLPDDNLAADMYALTGEVTAEAGLPAYEISNHAAPGSECSHNLIYWRCGEYLGVGPGAHGRVTRDGIKTSTVSKRSPEAWLTAVETMDPARTRLEKLSMQDQAEEYLMMSLRLAEGSELERYASLSGAPLSEDVIGDLNRQGLVKVRNGRLIATREGRLLLNGILRELLA